MTLLRKLSAPTLMTALLLASPASLAQNTAINWAYILFGGWFLMLNDLELRGLGSSSDTVTVTAEFAVNGYCINPALNQVTGTSALAKTELLITPGDITTIEKNGKYYIEKIHIDPYFDPRLPTWVDDDPLTEEPNDGARSNDFYYQMWLNCPNPNWYLINEDPDVDWDDRTSVYASLITLTIQVNSSKKQKPPQKYVCRLNDPVYTTAPDYWTGYPDPENPDAVPTNDNQNDFYLDDIVHYWRADLEGVESDWAPNDTDENLRVVIDEPFVLVHGYDPDPNDNMPGINQYACEDL